MNEIVETLWELQQLQFRDGKVAADGDRKIESLRRQIPDTVLAVFDRWLRRGKQPVSSVSHGACNGCHLQLPVASLGALAFGHGLEVCSHCGRFLYLPEDEPAVPEMSTAPAKPPRRTKEAPAHVK